MSDDDGGPRKGAVLGALLLGLAVSGGAYAVDIVRLGDEFDVSPPDHRPFLVEIAADTIAPSDGISPQSRLALSVTAHSRDAPLLIDQAIRRVANAQMCTDSLASVLHT